MVNARQRNVIDYDQDDCFALPIKAKEGNAMYDWNYFEDIPQYHPIADADNLYDAFQKARKGSQWKGRVQRFRWNALSETRKLQNELDNYINNHEGAYELSPYSCFTVNERGKIRAITALSVRDRIVKHALNDVYLLPHIRPHLIYDNGASLKGKGVSFTRNRLLTHLQKFYRETGSNEGYIMTMDFSGFYDNIDHDTAMRIISRYETDDFALKLVEQAFNSYKIDVSYMTDEQYNEMENTKFSMVEYRKENHTEEELSGKKYLHRSLSVGDQTSQIAAITFPTPIDNMIKIVCGCKYYGRYMDDFYIIAKTVDELKEYQRMICEKAKELKIFINAKKTNITRLDHAFTFLQFKYYMRDNGHVVVRINPKTVTRMRRKLKKLANLVKKGEASLIKAERLFQSWIGNYYRYMSKQQTKNLVTLYQTLYGGGLDQWMKERRIA